MPARAALARLACLGAFTALRMRLAGFTGGARLVVVVIAVPHDAVTGPDIHAAPGGAQARADRCERPHPAPPVARLSLLDGSRADGTWVPRAASLVVVTGW
jgi:hypothetical protein